jgi:hypothetical protein
VKYKVVIPTWDEGVLTCEMVNGKEVVIHAPKNMAWAIGKPTTEVFHLYTYLGRNNGGTVIEPLHPKRKLRVVRKKRRVIRIRRK